MKMKMDGKQKNNGSNASRSIDRLTWDACDYPADIPAQLEADGALDSLLELLDARFKYVKQGQLSSDTEAGGCGETVESPQVQFAVNVLRPSTAVLEWSMIQKVHATVEIQLVQFLDEVLGDVRVVAPRQVSMVKIQPRRQSRHHVEHVDAKCNMFLSAQRHVRAELSQKSTGVFSP